MILFWLIAGAVAGAAGLLVLARAARPGPAGDEAAMALRLYGEIDALVERGVLAPDQAEVARAEAGRRLLARSTPEVEETRSERQRLAVLGCAGLMAALGLGLYSLTGSPGTPDQPYAQRIAEWQGRLSTLGPAEMAEVAQAVAEDRSEDAEAWAFLGRARAQADQPLLAAQAFRRSLALEPGQADIWAYMGEALVRVSDGRVGADAEAAFRRALSLNPSQAAARYHLGLAELQAGRSEAALVAWRALAAELAPSDPRRDDLMAQIANVEAGRAPDAPQPLDAETRALAEGMVGRLAQRLADQPDDAQGWVRLVQAYEVLGDEARQAEALSRARTLFADQPQVLAALDEAAQ